jgi:hypothetical protein
LTVHADGFDDDAPHATHERRRLVPVELHVPYADRLLDGGQLGVVRVDEQRDRRDERRQALRDLPRHLHRHVPGGLRVADDPDRVGPGRRGVGGVGDAADAADLDPRVVRAGRGGFRRRRDRHDAHFRTLGHDRQKTVARHDCTIRP